MTTILTAGALLLESPAAAPARADAPTDDESRALAALRAGDLDEAERVLVRATSRSGTKGAWLCLLGHVLGHAGKRERGALAYQRALTVTRPPHCAYVGLAHTWAREPDRRQRRGERRRVLAQGLAAHADDEGARIELALALAAFDHAVGFTAQALARLAALSAEEQLTAVQALRVRSLADEIERQEALAAVQAWPPPDVSSETRRRAQLWLQRLDEGDRDEALRQADTMVQAHPDWATARFLRARARASSGRHAEAIADLEVLVRLDPEHAEGWALLGSLLSDQGGVTGRAAAARAIERALILAPAQVESWLQKASIELERGHIAAARAALERYQMVAPARAGRNSVRSLENQIEQHERRARARQGEATLVPPVPSDEARRLHEDAMTWLALGDPAGLAPGLLDRALAASPGFVAAALARHATGGAISDATLAALWQAPAALRALADGLVFAARRRSTPDALQVTAAQVMPWLDRAVMLGDAEALFERALLHRELGREGAALRDVRRYVGDSPAPTRLREALRLREAVVAGTDDEDARVRLALLEGRYDDARSWLAGACEPGGAVARAIRLEQVHELTGALDRAAACLLSLAPRLTEAADAGATDAATDATAGDGGAPAPLVDGDRARVLSAAVALSLRAPAKVQGQLVPLLERAVSAGAAHASLALALALAAGEAPDGRRVLALLDEAQGRLDPAAGASPEHERAAALRRRFRRPEPEQRGGWLKLAVPLLLLAALGWLLVRRRRR